MLRQSAHHATRNRSAALRRPNPGNSIPLPALWLDASSPILAFGTAIPSAPDRSGNGRICASSGNGPIPTYQAWPTGTGPGGFALTEQAEFKVGGPSLVLTGPCAVLAVFSKAQDASFFGVNPTPEGDSERVGLAIYADGNVYIGDDNSSFGNTPSGILSFPYLADGPIFARWYRGSAGWTFRLSGRPDVTVAGALGNLTCRSLVHRQFQVTNSPDGGTDLLAEMRIYDVAVEGPARSTVEAQMAAKWGVAL